MKARFSEEQIAFALRQAGRGVPGIWEDQRRLSRGALVLSVQGAREKIESR